MVTASERLKQESHTKNGQLNFLDNGHLGLLIKITSLTAPRLGQSPMNSRPIEVSMPADPEQTPGPFMGQSIQGTKPGAWPPLRAGESRRIVEAGDATIIAACEGSWR